MAHPHAHAPSPDQERVRERDRDRERALEARLEILERAYAASRDEVSDLRRRQSTLEEQLDVYWTRRSEEAQSASRVKPPHVHARNSPEAPGSSHVSAEDQSSVRGKGTCGMRASEEGARAGEEARSVAEGEETDTGPEESDIKVQSIEEEVAALFAPGGPMEGAFPELRLKPGEELVNSMEFHMDLDNLRRQILNCSGALAELHAKVASFTAHLLLSDTSWNGLKEQFEATSVNVARIASQTSEHGQSLARLGARLKSVEDIMARSKGQSSAAGHFNSSSAAPGEAADTELRAELVGRFRDLESRFDDLQVQFVMVSTANAEQ